MEFFIVDIQAERNGPPTPAIALLLHLTFLARRRSGALRGRCVSTTARQAADTLRDSKGFLRDNVSVISSDPLDFLEVFFQPSR